ncbi:MAG: carbohydrate-binding domain-containing protein [Bacteroidales bacterium]|nr:carbohydrate-binding domain-containing protein [Bacteroidales bacterium]
MNKQTLALIAALLAAVAFSACNKDDITLVDETDVIDNGGGSGSGSEPIYDEGEFDYIVRVVYSGTGATVEGTTDSITAAKSGAHVVITNSSTKKVRYQLSGSTSDGSFKLYSKRKQAVELSDVTITNPTGAAINIQSGKTAYVIMKGSSTLKDGSTYTTADGEDQKAAFFSEGQLIFSGSGSLNVEAVGASAITSDDYLKFTEGSVKVSSTKGHGLRGKDSVIVAGGILDVSVSANSRKGITTDGFCSIAGGEINITVSGGTAADDDGSYSGSAGIKSDSVFTITAGQLTISNSGQGGKGISGDNDGFFYGGKVTINVAGTNYGSSGGGGGPWGGGGGSSENSVGAKGIKFDGNLTFAGAEVYVNATSHEGIEAKKTLTISSGIVYSYSKSDDAINSGSHLTISGGYVYGHSAGNDGIDANGNMYIRGGLVYAIGKSSPEVALDANTEERYKLYVEGGTLITIGGLENGASLTQSCYSASSWNKNTWYGMTVGGNSYCFKTPSSGGSKLVVSGASTPTLYSGVTSGTGTIYFNNTLIEGAEAYSGGTRVNLSSYTGGGGGPGGH